MSKEIILHRKRTDGDRVHDWDSPPKLLPSGRYVLLRNSMHLECWDVAGDRLIWTHTSLVDDGRVLEFAAQEGEDGNSLVVMICVQILSSTEYVGY
jgi:hypothetical protein